MCQFQGCSLIRTLNKIGFLEMIGKSMMLTQMLHRSRNFCLLVHCCTVTSLVAQMVKHLSTMQETQVRYLGQEDPLEKELATHFRGNPMDRGDL